MDEWTCSEMEEAWGIDPGDADLYGLGEHPEDRMDPSDWGHIHIVDRLTKLKPKEINKRWKDLCDYLAEVVKWDREAEKPNFDQSAWCMWKDADSGEITDPSKVERCKTAACLAGHATVVIPGLMLREGEIYYDGSTYMGYEAFSKAMGIDIGVANRLTDSTAWHYKASRALEIVNEFRDAIRKELEA